MDEAIKIIWTEMNNHGDPERALVALQAEGFDLYRPDEFFLVPSKAKEDPDFEMPPLVGGDS